MTDRACIALVALMAYVFHRLDARLAWERQHHEQAVARWRRERAGT
jgi:hypothetical protein